VQLLIQPGMVCSGNFYWPAIGSGFYDFTNGLTGDSLVIGTPKFLARNMNGQIVITLGQDADTNGSGFQVITSGPFVDARGVSVPAGQYIQMLLTPTTTALFPEQTLTWVAGFTPTGGLQFKLASGILVFSSYFATPEAYNL
jgi:hypothetical protein